MNEFVGYRANAKSPSENNVNKGFATVYAERRNAMTALGEYGGDAYPIVGATEKNGHEFGIILAADGVGQGAYTHASLQKSLDRVCSDVAEGDKNFAKLSCFLRTLYGGKLFDEDNADALEYAVRSFADVPTDGFFVSPDEDGWKNKDANAQLVMPFFERDSQSLGSRILCVYIYLNYRNYMRDKGITVWTEEEAEAIRDKINSDIENDLTVKVRKLFRHDDIDNTTKKMRYFLCSTVAVWFYASDSEGHISALSLNCGDARTYVANTVDGVRQVSVDDAVPDGSMTGFFHFGSAPKKDEGFNDNTLHARIIEAQAPCLLFACSDGVYDTCPANLAWDGKKYSLPYGESSEANDFMFAKNMLEALRRSYSIEDFRREVVFNFYAQDSTRDVLEMHSGGEYSLVKRDDSATLAARFFGKDKNPLAILEELRKTHDTRIDALWDKLQESKNSKYPIPYYLPHAQSSDDTLDEKKVEYATNEFKNAISETLKTMYPKLFESMSRSGAQTIWGAPHPSATELTGFSLNQKFLKPFSNYVHFLETAIEDWTYLLKEAGGKNPTEFKAPQDWKLHEHVICTEEIFDILTDIDFYANYKQFMSDALKDNTGDVKLALYDWFEERFTGCVTKERNAVWTVEDDGRKDVNDDPAEIVKSLLGEDCTAGVASAEVKPDATANSEPVSVEAQTSKNDTVKPEQSDSPTPPAPETAEKPKNADSESQPEAEILSIEDIPDFDDK